MKASFHMQRWGIWSELRFCGWCSDFNWEALKRDGIHSPLCLPLSLLSSSSPLLTPSCMFICLHLLSTFLSIPFYYVLRQHPFSSYPLRLSGYARLIESWIYLSWGTSQLVDNDMFIRGLSLPLEPSLWITRLGHQQKRTVKAIIVKFIHQKVFAKHNQLRPENNQNANQTAHSNYKTFLIVHMYIDILK